MWRILVNLRRATVRFTLLLVLVYVYIICTIFHFSSFKQVSPVDCALTFGAVVHGSSYPGPGIARRVSAATELYHSQFAQKLLMTGGVGRTEQQSEAEVMKRLAQRSKVPLAALFTESQSTSTKENILFSRSIMKEHCSTVVVVSDPYHLARIAVLFKLYAPEVALQYHSTNLPRNESFYWYNIMRESIAIPYVIVEWLLLAPRSDA